MEVKNIIYSKIKIFPLMSSFKHKTHYFNKTVDKLKISFTKTAINHSKI